MANLFFCGISQVNIQSQIQDFPKEGARFRVKCHVDAIQWGGVVAEFFRDLQNPMAMRFSGGGTIYRHYDYQLHLPHESWLFCPGLKAGMV